MFSLAKWKPFTLKKLNDQMYNKRKLVLCETILIPIFLSRGKFQFFIQLKFVILNIEHLFSARSIQTGGLDLGLCCSRCRFRKTRWRIKRFRKQWCSAWWGTWRSILVASCTKFCCPFENRDMAGSTSRRLPAKLAPMTDNFLAKW